MNDLMETVSQALHTLANLDAKVTALRDALSSGRADLDTQRQRAVTSLASVTQRAEPLRATIETSRGDTETRTDTLDARLRHSIAVIESETSKVHAHADDAEKRLEAIGHALERVGGEAAEAAGQLRTTFDTAGKQLADAVTSLAAPLESLERFLAERLIPRVLADRTGIEQRSAEMQHEVRQVFIPQMTRALESLVGALEHARTRLVTSLESSAGRSRQEADHALTTLEERQERALREANEVSNEARGHVDASLRAIRQRITEQQAVVTGFGDRAGLACKAEDALVEIPAELRTVMIRARIITPSQIV